MTFRVWAPTAARVDVVIEGLAGPVAMTRSTGGWWEAVVDDAPAGTDYRFSVDGGDARPDPRSAWQPQGVHGPSRVVDHGAFSWTDGRWHGFHLPAAVLYELHVGTFSPQGTFDGVVERLDHLVELGVTAIELCPVAQFPGRHGWGYDGVDLFAVHDPYGGPEGLKRLVDACHARDLGVVIDVVYNHLGPAGNYLAEYGPYFPERYVTPRGQAVNFDGGGSDEVRRFVVDNALMWLRDYHADGLRLDAVHAIVDTSATHILEEVKAEAEVLAAHLGRPLWVIAESDLNDPRVVRSREAGGYGLDAQWSDDFHHALHVALTGERTGYYEDFSLTDVAVALERTFVHAGGPSPHRGRRHGRSPAGLPGWRFLGYAQNHDQVGNRAQGDRLSHLVGPGRLRAAAALVLTAPFVPMLFQGEEWGASTPFQYFTDHEDPELARLVAEGRRREFSAFGWDPEDIPDPQDPKTFERSQLDWAEIGDEPHASLLAWHRELIGLRRRVPELTDGRPPQVVVDERAGTIEVRKRPVRVLVDVAAESCTVSEDNTAL